jgi:hypothetical protein
MNAGDATLSVDSTLETSEETAQGELRSLRKFFRSALQRL